MPRTDQEQETAREGAEEGINKGRGVSAAEEAGVESTESSGSTSRSSSEIGIDSGDLAALMIMENAKVHDRSQVVVDGLKNGVRRWVARGGGGCGEGGWGRRKPTTDKQTRDTVAKAHILARSSLQI